MATDLTEYWIPEKPQWKCRQNDRGSTDSSAVSVILVGHEVRRDSGMKRTGCKKWTMEKWMGWTVQRSLRGVSLGPFWVPGVTSTRPLRIPVRATKPSFFRIVCDPHNLHDSKDTAELPGIFSANCRGVIGYLTWIFFVGYKNAVPVNFVNIRIIWSVLMLMWHHIMCCIYVYQLKFFHLTIPTCVLFTLSC